MEKTRKSICYAQKFRQAWKEDPKLKDWLRENESKPNKSYCIYCKCDLISKYCDLINHATTKKHLKAAVASQRQQLSESLPMIKDMIYQEIEQIESSSQDKEEYTTNQIEIESMPVTVDKESSVKKTRKTRSADLKQEICAEYNDPVNMDCTDEEDAELTEILHLADTEFETVTTTALQEKRIKVEIEYFQQKTEYFAKLTENAKIHKTLMLLQARKINLEIKNMKNEC